MKSTYEPCEEAVAPQKGKIIFKYLRGKSSMDKKETRDTAVGLEYEELSSDPWARMVAHSALLSRNRLRVCFVNTWFFFLGCLAGSLILFYAKNSSRAMENNQTMELPLSNLTIQNNFQVYAMDSTMTEFIKQATNSSNELNPADLKFYIESSLIKAIDFTTNQEISQRSSSSKLGGILQTTVSTVKSLLRNLDSMMTFPAASASPLKSVSYDILKEEFLNKVWKNEKVSHKAEHLLNDTKSFKNLSPKKDRKISKLLNNLKPGFHIAYDGEEISHYVDVFMCSNSSGVISPDSIVTSEELVWSTAKDAIAVCGSTPIITSSVSEDCINSCITKGVLNNNNAMCRFCKSKDKCELSKSKACYCSTFKWETRFTLTAQGVTYSCVPSEFYRIPVAEDQPQTSSVDEAGSKIELSISQSGSTICVYQTTPAVPCIISIVLSGYKYDGVDSGEGVCFKAPKSSLKSGTIIKAEAISKNSKGKAEAEPKPKDRCDDYEENSLFVRVLNYDCEDESIRSYVTWIYVSGIILIIILVILVIPALIIILQTTSAFTTYLKIMFNFLILCFIVGPVFLLSLPKWIYYKVKSLFEKDEGKSIEIERKANKSMRTGTFLFKRTVGRTRHSDGKHLLPLTILSIMALNASNVEACNSEGLVLFGEKTLCNEADGNVKCSLMTQGELITPFQNSISCLSFVDENKNETALTAEFWYKGVTCKLMLDFDYISCPYDYGVFSIKRCHGAGNCNGCPHVSARLVANDDDQIPVDYMRRYGYSYCESSCGCAGCGCGLCSDGCLWYRWWIQPRRDEAVRVFSFYDYVCEASVSVKTNKEDTPFEAKLKIGDKATHNGLTIELESLSAFDPSNLAGKKLVVPMDENKDAFLMLTADVNRPKAGMIGALQMHTEDVYYQNEILVYQFDNDDPKCSNSKDFTTCTFTNGDHHFDDKDRLPLTMLDKIVSYDGDLNVVYTSSPSAIWSISTDEKFTVSQTVREVCPEGSFERMEGYFSSNLGAKVTLLAKSSCFSGSVLITEDCENITLLTNHANLELEAKEIDVHFSSTVRVVSCELMLIGGENKTATILITGSLLEDNKGTNATEGSGEEIVGQGECDFWSFCMDWSWSFGSVVKFVAMLVCGIILIIILAKLLMKLTNSLFSSNNKRKDD